MKKILLPIIGLFVLAACNKDVEFPDYKYQTVYFAYQYPVRTITFGEDIFNTDLDNQGKCRIMATTGGVYSSKKNLNIGIVADNSLLGTGLLFGAGKDEVLPMPNNYYTLAANSIVIPEGELTGGVDVQLTEAFFNDPKAIKNTYVIPLKIVDKSGADSILKGKDFILYAIKYVNTWHGNYLRRGKDVITGGVNQTIVRHMPYVEDDEVNKLYTRTRKALEFTVVFKDKNGVNVNCPLVLTFDDAGKCTIAAANGSFTATGSGQFVKRGEKNSWGSKDRDALYLNYNVTLSDMQVASTDTLVMRDRSVTMETFTPVAK
ncbi:DUF1735 domain-containing protein [Paraflavitalea soli]|uniref:DUF1735 domain-containing protein n=1 Tax=Paraflavitalea soli TaxID=2315862 RepID=A0A3B7MMR0_9BACT|nr:DUF5627 domain-containing protein [Paraflavitalea soli]AXY74593.1 DUF1735 domain-containing protein [Paraflavitalea soli]